MAKKDKPSPIETILGKGALSRIQAAKLYFAGEIDAERPSAIAKGDPTWRILRYQRIVEPEKVSYPLSKMSYIRPDTFEKHLKYLTKHCRVVSVESLVKDLWDRKEVPDKTVAITLDGGWIDNFVYAYPLLLKYHATATMFLPTDFIGTNNYFWHDKVLFAMNIMKNVGLTFHPFSFFTKEQAAMVTDASPQGEISLPLIFLVISLLAQHSADNRALAVGALGHVVRQVGGDMPPEPAFMSWDDVRIMNSPLITFGSLGHTNARFSELDAEQLTQELKTSVEMLQSESRHVTTGVALPDGLASAEALETLAKAEIPFALGYDFAPPREAQFLRPLILPRRAMVEAETFATELLACRLWLNAAIEQ